MPARIGMSITYQPVFFLKGTFVDVFFANTFGRTSAYGNNFSHLCILFLLSKVNSTALVVFGATDGYFSFTIDLYKGDIALNLATISGNKFNKRSTSASVVHFPRVNRIDQRA